MTIRVLALAALVLVLAAAPARAYPQFQLSRDQTCSGCHLSPAGGGLLSENGLGVAETTSQWGTAPDPFYGKVTLPAWLALGGDVRGATGLDDVPPNTSFVTFPMQAELYAAATLDQWSLHVTGGVRDPQYQRVWPTILSSREHWLQWQQNAGEAYGLFVRAGRFMPVFGLRFAEHPFYDRSYGGTPLYGEAYGTAVEYIDPRWEVHATAFIHDPLQTDSIEKGNGATLYAEWRATATTALGVEGKYDSTPDAHETYGGVTAKHWLAGPGILLQGEVEFVHERVLAGGSDNQLVGVVLGSYFVGPLMVDAGIDVDEPNLPIRYLDREAADVNVHFFATSHVELLWLNRLEMLELGAGGLSSGYSLLQLHYRT